jgi:osmotically-inducible protein OsmY
MKPSILKRRLLTAGFSVAVIGAAASLSACVPLVIGGAAAGTALVATDRRTAGTQLEDQGIELRALSEVRNTFGTRVRVSTISFNRQVLLTGEVPSLKDKQAVEEMVKKIDNVDSVVNELGVRNSPSLFDRSGDLLITGRVKAAILDARDLQSNAFKVVTANNTVYLLGRVTKRESDRVTAIARGVTGVQRVVRIFETITEDELQRLQPGRTVPAAPNRA